MRLLVVSNLYPPLFVGGYELGCAQVVEALQHAGHEVLVLTSLPDVPVSPAPGVQRVLQMTDVFRSYYLDQSLPPVRHLMQAQANLVNGHNLRFLLQALDRFNPEAVYLWNLWGLGGLGILQCLEFLQLPWVWHLMDNVPGLLCGTWNGVEPALARAFGDHVRGRYLACSRRLVREIEETGIALRDEVEIVPNWICGTPPPQRTSTYTGGTLRLLYAGQLGRHKGVDLLLQMVRILVTRGYEQFCLNLYGNLTDPTVAEQLHQPDIRPHVRHCGVVSQADLRDIYAAHDLFVFPTWEREPFAFAPLEAAARGCVPLQSRCCGNSEWFVHGVHCLKAERTAEAFADAVSAVLDRRIDLAPLARRAHAAVWRSFHLDAVLPRIERHLLLAAARPRCRPGTAAEAYRLALLAEKLTHVLVQECFLP